MTASQQIRGLLAGVAAVAMIGTAIAQGSPPNPAVKSAPVGAGQQSSQQTPMGTTGTPTGAGTAGATSGSTAAAGTSGSGSMGSTAPTTGTTGTAAATPPADTTVAASTPAKRRVRADRN